MTRCGLGHEVELQDVVDLQLAIGLGDEDIIRPLDHLCLVHNVSIA